MQQKISLRLSPAEAADESQVRKKIAGHLSRKDKDITGFHILKKSIDARGKANPHQPFSTGFCG
jgi:hypothetical protein